MTFPDFQHLARLYVIGGIDEEDMPAFEGARRNFGEMADDYVEECRRLESVFALSLQPHRPRNDAKKRLMQMIQSGRRNVGKVETVATGKDRPLHGAPEGEL